MMISITNGPSTAYQGAVREGRQISTLWFDEVLTVGTRIYERLRKRALRKRKSIYAWTAADQAWWRGYQAGAKDALHQLVNEL